MKKYIAELIGTFILALTVVVAFDKGFGFLITFFAAIVVGLFVYTVGHISGAHLNPAITLGALSIKKIEWKDAIFYIIAQFAGAALAIIIVSIYKLTPGQNIPPLDVSNTWQVGVAEAIGAFFFAFGIASVIYHRANAAMSGIVIGGSLFIGLVIATALGSNAIVNPAVAFTLHSFSWVYALGPIVGAVLGMWAYAAVSETLPSFKK